MRPLARFPVPGSCVCDISSAAAGRPEVVAKKFNIKMAKVPAAERVCMPVCGRARIYVLRPASALAVFAACSINHVPRLVQLLPSVCSLMCSVTLLQVAKRTGLRAAAAAPTLAAPAQNVVAGSRRLKFNVSKPVAERALEASRDSPALATSMLRPRQSSLAAIAQKTSGGAVASPYWKPETAVVKDDKDDADRPAARSLRSRPHNA